MIKPVRLVETYAKEIEVFVRGKGFGKRTVHYAVLDIAGTESKVRISKKAYKLLR